MTQFKSAAEVLKKIEKSAQEMAMQVAAKTALVAIRLRRCSLAADVTRYWLKSSRSQSAVIRAAEDQRRQIEGAEGSMAAEEDRVAERQEAASAFCVDAPFSSLPRDGEHLYV